ncbi:MAG: ATP-binding protein [Lachnospiraceae bacterium]|nr:ATP-binding protein [Lachnospiraceae bacterium]
MEEIAVRAEVENLDQVRSFVDASLVSGACPMKVQLLVEMAVEEIFVNIANYAYPDRTGQARIRTELLQDPRRIQITFTDSGIPFDPLKKPDPDISLSLDEKPIGGLGIFMVKKEMDDVQYRYEDGKNILTFMKQF